MKLVSIIIVTFNREPELKECLASILSQDYKNIEIIIVNNGRKNRQFKEAINLSPKIKVIQNKSNKGPGASRNQGVKASKGDYIWFLDDDSELLHKKCLSHMVKLMGKDKSISTIGGELSNKKNPNDGKYFIVDETGRSVGRFAHLTPGKMIKIKKGYLPTCNCLGRAVDIREVGMFDPDYFFFAEDKELSYKLLKLRKYHVMTKKSLVLHKRVGKSRMHPIKTYYMLHRNRIRFYLKNMGLRDILLLPLKDIKYLFTHAKNFKELMETPLIALAYFWNLIFLLKTLSRR